MYPQIPMGDTNLGSKDGCVAQKWIIRELKLFYPSGHYNKSGIGVWISPGQEVPSLELLQGNLERCTFYFSWTTISEDELGLELMMALWHHMGSTYQNKVDPEKVRAKWWIKTKFYWHYFSLRSRHSWNSLLPFPVTWTFFVFLS